MKKSSAKSKNKSLDDALGDLLAANDAPTARKPAAIKKEQVKTSAKSKQSDVDFYSSLAADAGDESDVSEADATDIAKALTGLDDLDDDLLGSLGKKKPPAGKPQGGSMSSKPGTPAATLGVSSKPGTPSGKPPTSKPSTPTSALDTGAQHSGLLASMTPPTSSDPKLSSRRPSLDEILSKPDPLDDNKTALTEARGGSGTAQPRSRVMNSLGSSTKEDMDFDEDNPLAGLLSDEEDVAPASWKRSKKKPSLSDTAITARESEVDSSVLATVSVADSAANRVSLSERPPTRSGSRLNADDGEITSAALPVTPRQGKKKLVGSLDDDFELEKAGSSVATALLKKSTNKEINVDFDDDDGGLAGLGLDDDLPEKKNKAEEDVRPATAFMDSLLGRSASAEKPGLKEFVLERKLSSGATAGSSFAGDVESKRPARQSPGSAGGRQHASPTNNDEDDAGFGNYLPSAASTLSRPASQRSVRFEDEEQLEEKTAVVGSGGRKNKRASGLSSTLGDSPDDWLLPSNGPAKKQQHRPLGMSETMDVSGGGGDNTFDDDWLSLALGGKNGETALAGAAAQNRPSATTSGKFASAAQPIVEPSAKRGSGMAAIPVTRPSVTAQEAPTAPSRQLLQDSSSVGHDHFQLHTGLAVPVAGDTGGAAVRRAANVSSAPAATLSPSAAASDVDDDWLGIKKRTTTTSDRNQQLAVDEDDGASDWLSLSLSARRGSNSKQLDAQPAGRSAKVTTSLPLRNGGEHLDGSGRKLTAASSLDWLGVSSNEEPASIAPVTVPKRLLGDEENDNVAGGTSGSRLPAVDRLHLDERPSTSPTLRSRGGMPSSPKAHSAQIFASGLDTRATAEEMSWRVQQEELQKQEEQLMREQKQQEALWQQQQLDLQVQLKVQQEHQLQALQRRQHELADIRRRQHERVQQQMLEQQKRVQEGVIMVQHQLQAAVDGSTLLLPPAVSSQVQNDMALKQVDLEGKIRRLEMEKDHLQSLMESMKLRHLEEVAALEMSYKSRQQLADETFQRREARLKEENEALAKQSISRLKQLEEEKAGQVALQYRQLEEAEREKSNELERTREQHRLTMERMRNDHSEAVERLRKAKDEEIQSLSTLHSRSNSFQYLVDQMKHNASDLTSLQQRLQTQHFGVLDEREISARSREEQLKILQERLLIQQEENDKERTRLQELIVKMEVQMREQGRQLQEDQWKLSQDKSKLAALQASVVEEKRIVTDELSRERTELRRAKDGLLIEQKQILSQLYEERRALAEERSHFDASQRMLHDREHRDTLRHSQGAAEYEGLMKTVTEESAKLAHRLQELVREEELVVGERTKLELDRGRVAQEKDMLADLARRLKDRSAEMEQTCQAALRAREDGTIAMAEAQRIQGAHEQRLINIQAQLQVLAAKEKHMAEERLELARERQQMGSTSSSMVCAMCRSPVRGAHQSPGMPKSVSFLSSNEKLDQLADVSNLSLVRFNMHAERDMDYLAEESMYLESLKHAPYHSTQKTA